MKIAVFAGSFDPITNGHLDILSRASKMFDHVIILIGVNENKITRFSMEDRLEMIKEAVKDMENVSYDYNLGLTVEYARKHNALYLIRGIRDEKDLAYEKDMAEINKKLAPEIETIFLDTKEEYKDISSSKIYELIQSGGDISKYVPHSVLSFINK